MKKTLYLPRKGIKPNLADLVKRLGAPLLLMATVLLGWPSRVSTFATELDSEALLKKPQIHNFDVQVLRRSDSKRTYLFEAGPTNIPRVGHILLMKRDTNPAMAFRVIKTYPDKNRFVGTKVRRYGDYHDLEPGDSFTALEKIANGSTPTLADPTPEPDVSELESEEEEDLEEEDSALDESSPPALAPAASADTAHIAAEASLDEVQMTETQAKAETAPEPAPDDSELDSGSSPESASESFASEPEEEEEDDPSSLVIEEVEPLDTNLHWLTGAFGLFRNKSASGGSAYFNGAGFRYGLSLLRMLFIRRPLVQDSLTIEGGVFIYRVVDYSEENDAYTIVPAIGTARYNILIGESFGLFLYGGMMRNMVLKNSQGTAEGLAALASFVPAMGGGLIFHIGPNWDARVDLGSDTLGLGLMLRF